MSSKRIELPDDKTLIQQLRQLERRRGWSGKDSIDHRQGSHDDTANSVAGVAVLLDEMPIYADDLGTSVGGGRLVDATDYFGSETNPYPFLRKFNINEPF